MFCLIYVIINVILKIKILLLNRFASFIFINTSDKKEGFASTFLSAAKGFGPATD